MRLEKQDAVLIRAVPQDRPSEEDIPQPSQKAVFGAYFCSLMPAPGNKSNHLAAFQVKSPIKSRLALT